MCPALPGGSPLTVAAQGCGLQACVSLEIPLPHQVWALGSQRLAQAHSETAAQIKWGVKLVLGACKEAMLVALPGSSSLALAAQGCGIQAHVGSQRLAQAHSDLTA